MVTRWHLFSSRQIDTRIISFRNIGHTLQLAVLTVLIACLSVTASQAGGIVCGDSICYGDLMADDVWYRMVTEASNSGDALPLFGMPNVSGNSMDFDPVGFGASATGANGIDMTDGNLSFMVEAKPGNSIQNIKLEEAGDVSLAGGLQTDASASVTTAVFVDIEQVDGVGINPIKLQLSMPFAPSAGDFSLANDGAGIPLTVDEIWTGMLFIDIEQELVNQNISFDLGATKISVNLDNTLVATSEAGSSALIAKKDADGVIITTNIPEPTTALLMLFAGVIGTMFFRRAGR